MAKKNCFQESFKAIKIFSMMTSNLLTELFHPTTIITTSMLHFANNFGYCEKQSTEAVLLSDLSILGTGYNPVSCLVLSCIQPYWLWGFTTQWTRTLHCLLSSTVLGTRDLHGKFSAGNRGKYRGYGDKISDNPAGWEFNCRKSHGCGSKNCEPTAGDVNVSLHCV